MEGSSTILFLLFILAVDVFWIWALVDVIRRASDYSSAAVSCSGRWSSLSPHMIGVVTDVLLGRRRATEV